MHPTGGLRVTHKDGIGADFWDIWNWMDGQREMEVDSHLVTIHKGCPLRGKGVSKCEQHYLTSFMDISLRYEMDGNHPLVLQI